ncbi:hypothetical protein [Paenarthrobacter sp. NPDC090522]|uniref:hypothetical protein n=1 Tax=Paenarthrobacter sp. NPDC090522 TaxID=3364383 RepID=UPI0037FDA850
MQQIVEGLALGVLARGIVRLPATRDEFTSAFRAAWCSWPKASAFDAIDFTEAASVVWVAMDSPVHRPGVMAGWLDHSVPVLTPDNEDQDIAYLLDSLSDIVSASDWIQLGSRMPGPCTR